MTAECCQVIHQYRGDVLEEGSDVLYGRFALESAHYRVRIEREFLTTC